MRLLLDTHVFLWLRFSPEKVSRRALAAYRKPANEVFLSLVSVWEIQIKQQLGKLDLDVPLAQLLYEQREHNAVQFLPIELPHILTMEELPFHHKDPFDRLLIAQAIREEMTLVSSDGVFSEYSVPGLW
uniref:PIN domain nuclease, a component of toxin-antitoxin system (PIN domain) n=1 Tax=Candidatus Kentrum eta TaxID=2126337 RepID=A0A450U8M2_9GAMM|nr:MAG: PIN domain nuclease, a component of toxin-antitoxin system (PIN domain) [Candidatus Kentron sp. H]VFJ88250.1 MAG: PIN domain nuclease, a component of toxin-antitoxin system (PIN domain) [Candidatus Kentron sp. H]VFJ95469.1 MAG: PIN domain nuclease, a component of toxin-antitoxin system (PIN domain) [Candidatus Kentron sp. H]